MTDKSFIGDAADALARLRDRRPRIHCITNTVAQPLTANGLLALGAVPSLTVNPTEIAEFVSGADALLVNLGTLDRDRIAAIETALEIAVEEQCPFVLDPVFVNVSNQRRAFARTLVEREPAVIRLNHPELVALADKADPNPERLALDWLTVLAVTGETDCVTDGAGGARIGNGHPLMMQVTAMGCLASAVVAAFLPVTRSAVGAALAGLGVMGIAGEAAAAKASGPGTFTAHFIDALASLTPDRLRNELDIDIETA